MSYLESIPRVSKREFNILRNFWIFGEEGLGEGRNILYRIREERRVCGRVGILRIIKKRGVWDRAEMLSIQEERKFGIG